MEQTLEELRATIEAKRAYGVKTTRLENELYRRERAAMPAWRRVISDAIGNVFIVVFALLFWGLQLAPILLSVAHWFNN